MPRIHHGGASPRRRRSLSRTSGHSAARIEKRAESCGVVRGDPVRAQYPLVERADSFQRGARVGIARIGVKADPQNLPDRISNLAEVLMPVPIAAHLGCRARHRAKAI